MRVLEQPSLDGRTSVAELQGLGGRMRTTVIREQSVRSAAVAMRLTTQLNGGSRQ